MSELNPNSQLLEAALAFQAAEALSAAQQAHSPLVKAAIVDLKIRYTVWRYEVEALSPSPNICKTCENRKDDYYELDDPDDLLDMFPYGEWLDEDTFAVNQHPYCRCIVTRDHDVYW